MSTLPVPPWLIRRLLLAPLLPILGLIALALLPLVTFLDAAVGAVGVLRRPHRRAWRLPRVWAFAVLYLLGESVCLVALLALWLASGLGLTLRSARMQTAHLALLRWLLAGLVRAAGFVFRFRLVVDEPDSHPEDGQRMAAPAPLLVLARHAGPGASFVLVHLLLSRYRRRPRVVLKHQLRYDPCIDILLSRLGCAFIDQRERGQATERVADLARSLGDHDALLLYPEGGDWSPTRHRLAVLGLRKRGRIADAEQAARLTRVLPPRPAGTAAAVHAAPNADVVVFTHTGHDDLRDAGTVWRNLPLRRALHMVWWREAAGTLPDTEAGMLTWLQSTWADIDAWVREQDELDKLTPHPAGGPDLSPERV